MLHDTTANRAMAIDQRVFDRYCKPNNGFRQVTPSASSAFNHFFLAPKFRKDGGELQRWPTQMLQVWVMGGWSYDPELWTKM